MNMLVEKGAIEERECGTNFAYILKDNTSFLSTEYKVLQSQTNSSFIKCMKMLYNGKIELYYLVNTYKSISSLLSHLDPDQFITMVGNLFAGILDVKNNGFLVCYNIDSTFEHIYVDQNTYKVGLVYLPLNIHEYSDSFSFENALRTNLVHAISSFSSLSSPKTAQLSADLQNGLLSIEEIYSRLGGKGTASSNIKNQTHGQTKGRGAPAVYRTAKLVALNAPIRVEIQIDKSEFTIGKKDSNDGIISFNKMISRVHCKISNNDQRFMISDLQSANGTFVNGIRLQPNKPTQIHHGDIVRLANSEFQVVIE